MNTEIATVEADQPEKSKENTIQCPDCETEYPAPQPGAYKCPECFCKFTIDPTRQLKIIPFFDEMKFEPILVMIGVLGLVLLVGMDDSYLPFMERLKIFLLFFIVIFGGFKLVQFLCRKYRGADRFFRRISRPRFIDLEKGLIKMKSDYSSE